MPNIVQRIFEEPEEDRRTDEGGTHAGFRSPSPSDEPLLQMAKQPATGEIRQNKDWVIVSMIVSVAAAMIVGMVKEDMSLGAAAGVGLYIVLLLTIIAAKE